MAKPTGSRPSSRQSQDGPPAARTRSARSQSEEPSSPQRTRGRGRGGGNTGKRGGRGAKVGNVNELPPVDEDAAVEEQLQQEMHIDEPALGDDLTHARRISGNSGMSGTTAKTSFSQEEISELDSEIMIDVLPSLSSAADELAKLLVPADPKARAVVRKEITVPNSKHNKLYNNRLAAFGLHKHAFGSTDYIQPSIVLRKLFEVEKIRDVPDGFLRPDAIIYKINLAVMLRITLISLFDNPTSIDEGYNALEALDVHFPSGIAGQTFSMSAFDMCLSIMTQLAIVRVAAYMTDLAFNAREAVTNAFYTLDEDEDLVFRHRSVMHMMPLSPEEQTDLTERIHELADELLAMVDGVSAQAALGALRERYPWDSFVNHIVEYYLTRKEELDQEITAVGGVDQIVLGLAEEIERKADAKAAEEKRQSFSKPGSTPQKGFGKAGTKALKARARQLKAREGQAAASTAPVLPVAPIAPMAAPNTVQPSQSAAAQAIPGLTFDDGWQRPEDDEEPIHALQAQPIARSTLAAMSQLQNTQAQNAARYKRGRSFLDPQEGAQRVNWDDGSQLTEYSLPSFQQPRGMSAQAPYYGSPKRGGSKRPYAEVEDDQPDFDPTPDGDFEVDTRDVAAADQRRAALPSASRVHQARLSGVRTGAPVSSGHTHAHPNETPTPTQTPSKRPRKNPGSTIPPPPAPFDPDDDITIPQDQRMARARIAARHGTIMATQNKPVQTRTPWSGAEENALLEIIEQEADDGISYSKLKALDDARGAEKKLERRSAEDMRFKARNMKETFIRSRTALPRNFDKIVLDKKAITKIRNLGIQYEQDRIRNIGEVGGFEGA